MKCLTIELDGETMEVHMLNPREHFPNFGGSRHGLVVGKTASLVLSRRSPTGQTDTELDIHAASFWRFIAACINGEHVGAKATGEARDTPGKGAGSGTEQGEPSALPVPRKVDLAEVGHTMTAQRRKGSVQTRDGLVIGFLSRQPMPGDMGWMYAAEVKTADGVKSLGGASQAGRAVAMIVEAWNEAH